MIFLLSFLLAIIIIELVLLLVVINNFWTDMVKGLEILLEQKK
jgi:hypothetical protein